MVAQQWLQGRELLGPLAPYLLEQGLWHRRTGSTTSTNEQLRKEEKKTHQQFKKLSSTLHKLLGWKMRNRPQQLAEDFYGVRIELSKLGHGQGTGPTSLRLQQDPMSANTQRLGFASPPADSPRASVSPIALRRTDISYVSHQFLMRPGLFTAALSHTSTDPIKHTRWLLEHTEHLRPQPSPGTTRVGPYSLYSTSPSHPSPAAVARGPASSFPLPTSDTRAWERA